jgi:hypothetical protein
MVSWSLQSLLLLGDARTFFVAHMTVLSRCRPFAKFLCIKGVVFMTFWQGLAITILAGTTDVGGADSTEWASSAQNFLICLEMLLFSIAHFYCFPTYEWDDAYKANFNKAKYGFNEQFALGDFISDLKLVMKGSKKNKKKTAKEPSEPTVPEEDEETATATQEGGDDDESETVVSDATGNTSHTEDPKRSLAEAVASVIADSENPDLEDVKQRISGFLEDMAFMPGETALFHQESVDTSENAADDFVRMDDDEEAANERTSLAASTSYGSNNPEEEEEEPAPRIIDWVTGEGEEENPTEKTSLLGGVAAQSPLRPSIFTTIASMTENKGTKQAEKASDEIQE